MGGNGIKDIMAKLLRNGLDPNWLLGLDSKPSNWKGCGLKIGAIKELRLYGIIEKNKSGLWTKGENYRMALKFLGEVD